MFSPREVLTHLQTFLPAFTDLFSNVISGATASISGSTLTVGTPTNHAFVPGDKLTFTSAVYLNSITAAIDNGDDTVRFTVANDHDLTMPGRNDFALPTDVTLQGVGGAWDGSHTLVAVPNRRTFEIEIPAGETGAPGVAGELVETRSAGITGLQEVATVPTPTSFTIELANIPTLPDGTVQGVTVLSDLRIAGVEDVERAEEIYAKRVATEAEARPWAFLMMTGTDASKDRQSHNDAIASFTVQDMRKQTLLQNFAVIVILPTSADKTGFDAQAQAHEEVFRALSSTLYGYRPEDPESQIRYVAVSNGHGPGAYNTSYYTHVYDWQVPSAITYESGFGGQADVAFRNIVGNLNLNGDELAQLQFNSNLDDEPLP